MSDRVAVRDERSALGPRRVRGLLRPALSAGALALAFALAGCGGAPRDAAQTTSPPADTAASRAVLDTLPVGDEARIGPYVVRVIGREDEPQRVIVTRGGRTVHETATGWRMRIGRLSGPEAGGVEPGTDVNADGIPDVTLWDWSGGAHCCFTTIVLSLGDRVDSLVTIATGNSGGRFVNLDEDPALEFETAEDGFSYWPGSFAGSPHPRVVLDWNGRSLEASCALTFHPVSDDAMRELTERLRKEIDWTEGPLSAAAGQLFSAMADLQYAGRPDLAMALYRELKPEGKGAELDPLLVEYGTILGRSPHWNALDACMRERQP